MKRRQNKKNEKNGVDVITHSLLWASKGWLDKIEKIKAYYNELAEKGKYGSTWDFNLRKLEIEYILRELQDGLTILDIGCGDGFSSIIFATRFKCHFEGIDFSVSMIKKAREMAKGYDLQGTVRFNEGDVLNLKFSNETFDVVISERCLINIPSWKNQKKAIKEIHRVLKPSGKYLMMESTIQGLNRLNKFRREFGLRPIQSSKGSNWMNLKFDEDKLVPFLNRYFKIRDVKRFGIYYLISRVIHPLLVEPNEPKYEAKINEIAQKIAMKYPNYEDIGHLVFLILEKLKVRK